ncbi:MAG: LuxR C-terminal-related transcriptional regulator [Actinomycetota bacterium]
MPRDPRPTLHRRPAGAHRLGVVVVDPLPVVRAGLAMLIEDRPDLQVLAEVGTAGDCLEILRRLKRTTFTVLVGLGLTGEHDSPWLIRMVREQFPSATILACGANAEPAVVSRALFVGADGYVDKDEDPVDFLQAIRAAADGEVVLPGNAADWVAPIADGLERRQQLEVRLTERERQVLEIAAEGLTARAIADRLGVRERTITTHLGRIYGKLGVHGRVGAVLEAARSGLVTVRPGDE